VLKGFWIVAALVSFLLGPTEVAAAQIPPGTVLASAGDLPLSGIVGGSTSGVATDGFGAIRRPVPHLVPPLTFPRMSPELALSIYERRTTRQSTELASYSDTTVVRAELPEISQQGEFKLERRYSAPRSLVFKALQFTGDNFIKGNVITRLLQSEVDHVQNDNPSFTVLTSANYKFSYKATPMFQGRVMHVYQVKPRKKRVGLFKGRIYLDAYTGSLLYATGSPVKSPSLFIKKIEFLQQDADFGPFTFPVHIHIEASTRLVGRAIVDFDHRDYKPLAVNVQANRQSPVTP
jgi:hypothetical protein